MITRYQAIQMGSTWGQTTLYHVTLRNADGSATRARVNGKCKVWKTRPKDFQLPMKHGLKVCFYLTPRNAHEWMIEDPTQAERDSKLREKQITQAAALVKLDVSTPLPILHDALVDAGKDGAAQLVALWIKRDTQLV